MLILIVFLTIFINISLCDMQNEGNSIYNYTSLNGDKIQNITEYCQGKRCIAKCCRGDTMFFNFNFTTKTFYCKDMEKTQGRTRIDGINPHVQVYKKNIEKEIAKSNLTLNSFRFVNSDKFFSQDLFTEISGDRNFYILEDASLMIEAPNYFNRWVKINGPTDYCMDMVIVKKRSTGAIIKRIRYGRILETDIKSQSKSIYIAVAMLISSFFLILVLIVYGLLPKLRNIVGMVLMAYVANLLVWFTMKAIHTLYSFNGYTCNITSPIMYFTILASFFWLNIMSFDIWWTFRGTRKCRDIHRRGELVKFLWYCLYAWGTPMAVTIGNVVLDRSHVRADIVKPHFNTCLYGVYENMLFTYIPIIILTAINCILFFLTIYNIWLIHRGMKMFNAKDSQKNKNTENRFFVFIKMSVLMGVSWILEILQSFAGINEPWLYILVNTYNAFLGVAIFFFFVFKKSIIVMLCKSLMRQDEQDDRDDVETSLGRHSRGRRTARAIGTARLISPIERSASFIFTRGFNQFHINNRFVTRIESNMSSRNDRSDSSRKQISRTDSETTDTALELKDANNMIEISLHPNNNDQINLKPC